MKQTRSLGFSLIELLVVISIIAVLASFVIANVRNSQEQADRLAVKSQIDDISNAIQAYYEKTNRYPNDRQSDAPTASNDHVVDGEGYLYLLENGHKTQKMENGTLVEKFVDYIEYSSDATGTQPDMLYDMWGNSIRYRRAPKNTVDYKRNWDDSVTGPQARDLVNGFPGNPKRFNLWSPGKDKNLINNVAPIISDQRYQAGINANSSTIDGYTITGPTYLSGGRNEAWGGVGDAYLDDVWNW